MTHRASFNIVTPRNFLHEMIIPQHENFIEDNSSSRHALLTITLVYHMYEWVHETKFTESHFKSVYPPIEHRMVEKFDLARNITNGTKHFKAKANTHVQLGFSSDFSEDFARPLNIELPNGEQQSADSFLDEMVRFWERQERRGIF